MKRRTLCRLVVQASTMIRITILQALVEQSTVGIGSGRGRAEGRESAQRRLDVAEVQRHALSLRSSEAIASHLSLLPRIGTPDGLRLLLCFCETRQLDHSFKSANCGNCATAAIVKGALSGRWRLVLCLNQVARGQASGRTDRDSHATLRCAGTAALSRRSPWLVLNLAE